MAGADSEAAGKQFKLQAVRTYLLNAVPIYAFFLLMDRVYQFIRFGSWTNTYVDIFAQEQRQMNPSLPANFPFNGGWFRGGIDSGVIGPFFAPAKSIFLFDPPFLLVLVLTVLLWKRMTLAVRAFFAATLVMLAAYVAFYARYNWWAGDFAWGDRYISSAVELTTLLAIPLLLRYREVLGRAVWYFGLAVTGASVVIQCASLAFWLPLEIYQMDAFGRHTWVVFLRFKNIAAFALGVARGVGAEYADYVRRSVGRGAHYGVELPAIAAAPYRCGSTVGRTCSLWRVVRRCGCAGGCFGQVV